MIADPRRLNPWLVFAVLALGAGLFAFLQWRGTPEPEKVAAGALWGFVGLILRAEKKEGTGVAGHVPGADPLGRGGVSTDPKSPPDSGKNQRDAIELKRELLASWAKAGQEIDRIAEFKAELVAAEVLERGARWEHLGDDSSDAGAGDASTEAPNA